MIKKMMMVAAAGAGAVYLMDPNKGPDRRRRALRLWAENKDQILEAAGWATGATSTLRPVAGDNAGGSGGGVEDVFAGKDPNTATGNIGEHVVAG